MSLSNDGKQYKTVNNVLLKQGQTSGSWGKIPPKLIKCTQNLRHGGKNGPRISYFIFITYDVSQYFHNISAIANVMLNLYNSSVNKEWILW